MPSPPEDLTQLLIAWNEGDPAALDRLMPLVYQELHGLAQSYLSRERSDHSLQPTALVNEAYLRLIEVQRVRWENRSHFFAISAKLLRQVLVDFARRRSYQKRGGGLHLVSLDATVLTDSPKSESVAELDEAMLALAEFDERKSRIVELRFFGGMTVEECAQVLEISPETVKRDWRFAKSWLRRFLTERGEP